MLQPQRIQQLGICLGVFALLASLLVYRMGRNSEWLLTAPLTAGPWEAIETPLSQDFLLRLAMPKNHGVTFRNPLDEQIECQIIAPNSFEAFREPEIFTQFQISAQRSIPLFGPDKPVRAWVLKVPNQDFRILCYAWLQSARGKTTIFGTRGMKPGIMDRFTIGWASVVREEPICLVRLYSRIAPSDTNAVLARRNLELVARKLYDANSGAGK
jgi:hypothetical protein